MVPTSSASDQAFCLKLNAHQNHLIEAFQKLFNDEIMTDCTLSCQGGTLKAHKLVLSACSPYFTELFSSFSNPNQYPIVILKDMLMSDLEAIIEFMYKGEVTITQNSLASVLDSAKSLMITGLCDIKIDNFETGTKSGNTPPRTSKKRRRSRGANNANKVISDQENQETESEVSDAEKSEPEIPIKVLRKDEIEINEGQDEPEKNLPLALPAPPIDLPMEEGHAEELATIVHGTGGDDPMLSIESGDSNASQPGPSTRFPRSPITKLSPSAAFKANLRQMRIEKIQHSSGGLSGRKMWSDEETRALVKIWEEESARVWASAGKKVLSLKRISDLLQEENIDRDVSQVEGKIKALKRDFKAIKQNRSIPAVQARLAPHLDKLEAIFSREEL